MENNTSGIEKLYIGIADKLRESIDDRSERVKSDLEFAFGYGFEDVRAIQDSVKYKSKFVENQKGTSYKVSVSFVRAKLGPETIAYLRKYKGRGVVLLLFDANGQRWVIGNKDNVFEFEYDENFGSRGGKANEVKVSLRGDMKLKARLFEGKTWW